MTSHRWSAPLPAGVLGAGGVLGLVLAWEEVEEEEADTTASTSMAVGGGSAAKAWVCTREREEGREEGREERKECVCVGG